MNEILERAREEARVAWGLRVGPQSSQSEQEVVLLSLVESFAHDLLKAAREATETDEEDSSRDSSKYLNGWNKCCAEVDAKWEKFMSNEKEV